MAKSIWLDALNWMIQAEKSGPKTWPVELPPEKSSAMWPAAARLEMQHRAAISEKIAQLIEGTLESSTMAPLEFWYFGRRCEFAAQIVRAKVEEGIEPPTHVRLPEVLRHLLIRAWDSDGCIGFWNHAFERGGKPPSGNSTTSL